MSILYAGMTRETATLQASQETWKAIVAHLNTSPRPNPELVAEMQRAINTGEPQPRITVSREMSDYVRLVGRQVGVA